MYVATAICIYSPLFSLCVFFFILAFMAVHQLAARHELYQLLIDDQSFVPRPNLVEVVY